MDIVPQDPTRNTPNLRVPHVSFVTACGDHGPTYSCNRPADHTGRHCYSWQHMAAPFAGKVRGVWS